MNSHNPRGDVPGSAASNFRRSSVSANFRASLGNSSLPRPQTSLRESRFGTFRASSTQPSYNLLTGESTAAPNMRRSVSGQSLPPGHSPPQGPSGSTFSRESSKENHAPPDAEEYETQRRRIEELKAEVGTLRYTVSNLEQERDLTQLQSENDLREAKRKGEDDFKAKQTAEAEKSQALRQVETLQLELDSLRAEQEAKQKELESKARDALEEARVLREQLEDLNAAKEDAARLAERQIDDLQGRVSAAQRTAQELQQENQNQESSLDKLQAALREKEDKLGEQEAEILRLKAATGDVETITVIRRELTDQVNHIRKLEQINRDQLSELKHLRQTHKAKEILEEEKRSLQRKLQDADLVETALGDEKRQRQRLENERLEWMGYLERQFGPSAAEFESPMAMARGLVQERLNVAALTEQLGQLQPEITDRDNVIKSLEAELENLRGEVEKLKKSGSPASESKWRARIERQRALAVKEVEYLREQLKTFVTEDMTISSENFDAEKSDRIKSLEDMVDQYRTELEAAVKEIEVLSSQSQALHGAGTKRPREDDEDGDEAEQVGQLARKSRKMQDELAQLQDAHRLLETEYASKSEQLAAAREQLAAAHEQLKTRVLSLRSNPTSDHEAVKAATLRALKLENAELLAHIEQNPTLFATIPASQIASFRRELEAARARIASAEKSLQRQREVWAAKSGEYREAVDSTLGWKTNFLPGGKMRVESIYYPSLTDEYEHSIVFDGERGTMKIGGGPQSPFAQRIDDNVKFWVREKASIPCFLAALQLEFYDEYTKASMPA